MFTNDLFPLKSSFNGNFLYQIEAVSFYYEKKKIIFTHIYDTKRGSCRGTKWHSTAEVREWTPLGVMLLPWGFVMWSLSFLKKWQQKAAALQHPDSQKSNQKCIMAALMQSSFLLLNLQQLLVWKHKYCTAIWKALFFIRHQSHVRDVTRGGCVIVLEPF